MNIEINKQFKQKYIVSDTNTAKFMGSGDLEVLATPSLVAFMENAAKTYLNAFLYNSRRNYRGYQRKSYYFFFRSLRRR